jgi:hypothetical protein
MAELAASANRLGATRAEVVAILEAAYAGEWRTGAGTTVNGADVGYLVAHYVDEDGHYLGPDQYGIEPVADPAIRNVDSYTRGRLAAIREGFVGMSADVRQATDTLVAAVAAALAAFERGGLTPRDAELFVRECVHDAYCDLYPVWHGEDV